MDRPLFYSDERVDLLDFVRALLYGQVEATRNLRALLVPEADPRGYVFEGFAITPNGIGNGVLVTFGVDGRMLLGENRDGTIFNGHIAEDEAGALTVELLCADFTPPAGVGWYDLYIRLILDPGTGENRAFWSSVLGSEYLALVDTSDRPTFELAAVTHGAAAPWAEGVKIAEIDNTLGAPGVILAGEINPQRRFFFEGEEDQAVPYHPSWGDGANDRNAARDLHGIHDLYTFSEFVRRQLQDIMGHDLNAGILPWTAVHTNLPSLESLHIEHTPSGSGWGSHHLAVQIHGATAAANRLSFVPHDGTATLVAQQGVNYLDFGRAAASPTLRMLLSGAGLDGGLSISGPDGPAADMVAGDSAYLLFGKSDDLLASRDFRIKATGAAADTGRGLFFQVGAGAGVDALVLDGNGDAAIARYCSAGLDYRHPAARAIRRTLSGAAFTPLDETAVAYPPHTADMTTVIFNTIQPIYGVSGPFAQTPELGMGFNAVTSGDAANYLFSVHRYVASCEFLPNNLTITIGGSCDLVCEASAAFLAAANQRLEFALVARRKTLAPLFAFYVVAIVRFLPTGVPDTVTGVWVAGPDWAAHGAAINHTAYGYTLVAQAYDGGVIGATAGTLGAFSLGLRFDYSTFQH